MQQKLIPFRRTFLPPTRRKGRTPGTIRMPGPCAVLHLHLPFVP
nr:hypothetical protein RVX_1275 [Nitratidesulfovibrio sp. HK-II]